MGMVVVDEDTGLDDPGMMLVTDLIQRLQLLVTNHGEGAYIEFDASPCNISVRVLVVDF